MGIFNLFYIKYLENDLSTKAHSTKNSRKTYS